ncbi:MAG: hypothetical protein ACKV2U_20960 [Bryobacteraceae bacterium]
MKRRYLIVWALTILAIGGCAWWYLFTPGTVPPGQTPLADEPAFRQAFHNGVQKTRIVVLLSPTTPSDLITAQDLQSLLMEYENDTLDAHVIWQPLTRADWAPTTDAMARVWDTRARHYWDKAKNLRTEMGEGQAFIYARGAALDKPALRVTDWKTDLPRIREFLGTPKRVQ